jgi:hypothetical protein
MAIKSTCPTEKLADPPAPVQSPPALTVLDCAVQFKVSATVHILKKQEILLFSVAIRFVLFPDPISEIMMQFRDENAHQRNKDKGKYQGLQERMKVLHQRKNQGKHDVNDRVNEEPRNE